MFWACCFRLSQKGSERSEHARAARLVIATARRRRIQKISLEVRMKFAQIRPQAHPSAQFLGPKLFREPRCRFRDSAEVLAKFLHFAEIVLGVCVEHSPQIGGAYCTPSGPGALYEFAVEVDHCLASPALRRMALIKATI